MGFMTWERYRCTISGPDAISAELIKRMASALNHTGLQAAGYTILSIDDCYLSHRRSSDGKIQPDPHRFPDGMRALAEWLHARGLFLGVYEDIGIETCAGFPGCHGHFEDDVTTMASWRADYLKLDGCNEAHSDMPTDYPAFSSLVRSIAPNMTFSCSWPAYVDIKTIDWELVVANCNLWRYGSDVQDSWASVVGIIHNLVENQNILAPLAGPGHWNDPDQLIIGNVGLDSLGRCRCQMGIWALISAPLFISTDLETIRPEHVEILGSREVIAIDQDSLGIQAVVIDNPKTGVTIWRKKMANGAYSLGFLNLGSHAVTAEDLYLSKLLPCQTCQLKPRDVWVQKYLPVINDHFSVDIPAEDLVLWRFDNVNL